MKTNKHRFWVGCCMVLAVLISAVLGCAKREIVNMDSRGKNIICFGDSITFGYGVQQGQDYPRILSEMINLPVINAGIDGDTSTEGLRRIETDVLSRQPFLVIIEFGGNDFLRKTPEEEIAANIAEMVDNIQSSGAMAAIADVSMGIVLNRFRSQLQKIAREKGAIFIPSLLNGIITNPNLKSDFLHPNQEGYKLIAQRVYRAIIPYLNRNIVPALPIRGIKAVDGAERDYSAKGEEKK